MKFKFLILILSTLSIFAQGNQKAVITFDTVADMVARGNPRNIAANVVYVLGYRSTNGGGGGMFVATNTVTSTNLGTRIKSQLAGWSWERVLSDADTINVLDHGATINDAIDDGAAMQSAFDAAIGKSNSFVWFPSGVYTNSSVTAPTITWPTTVIGYGATLRGGGSARRLLQVGATGLSSANRLDRFTVMGFRFYFGAAAVTNSIHVSPWITRAVIQDCDFQNVFSTAGASEIYFGGENWESAVDTCFFYPSGSIGSRAITTNPNSIVGGSGISPNSNIKITRCSFSGLSALVEPAIDISNTRMLMQACNFNRNHAIHLRNGTDGSGAFGTAILDSYFESGNDSTNDAMITFEGQWIGGRIDGCYFNLNNRQIGASSVNGLVLRPSDGTAKTIGLQYTHNIHNYFTNEFPIFLNVADPKGVQYGNFESPVTSSLDYGPDYVPMTQVDNLLSLRRNIEFTSGSIALVGGTITVNTTEVTANSRIMLTVNTAGGTVGSPYVSARVAGTSFTITSTSGTDTSTVFWTLHEP